MDSTERARVLAQNLQPGDKQTAEAALGGLCAELRSGQVHLLNQYVQLSPQCAELFALWENQEGDGNRIVTLVIETLANVLEKKFDEGLRTVKTRQGVAAKVLSEHLQLLYRYLGTERDQLLKVCLRLLTGISSTSQALSAQLLRTFNFGLEGFSRLANRRFHVPKKEKKEKAQIDAGRVDVRSLFSSFALSFLQWKDPALTSSALGIKDLIGGVLRGLSQDPPKQALTVVRDVLEHVVRLKQLPRQTKVFFFNAFALRHFCSLLSSEDQELSSAANELLKEVCCSRQLFPSHKEELLLDICLELRTHEAQQEFVIAVLRSHPALHLQFCGRLKLALQPRLSRAWLLNIRFLRTLLEMEVSSLRSEALNLIGHENTDAVQELRLSWIQEALIPKAMQKTLITQALLQQNAIIRLAALQLLIAALQRLQRAVVGCSWEPAEKEELLQRAQHQLPELNTLLLLWQQLCKEEPSFDLEGSTPSKSKGAKGAKGAKRKHGGAAEEWPVENGDNGDADAYETTEVLQVTREEMLQWMGLDGPDMPSHLVFTCWCKSIQRYLEVLPQSALDVKFDWSKLLSAVATPIIESKGGDVYRTLACVKCVAVAMHSRSQSMQLSKSQRAWLETLLRLRSSASVSEELREECTGQILTFLLGRGLLGRSERVELELLLLALEKRPQCVGFVGQVLQALFSRPGYFMSLAEAPSLLPVALLQHLTRRDPQSLALPPSATQQQRSTTALTCCKMVKHFLLQMASSLPETAKAVLGLVRSIGEWKAGSVAQEEEDPSTAGDTPAEGLRQELLEKLRSRKRKREDDDGPPEAPEADAVAEAMAALKSEELLLPQKREVFLKLAQDDRITLLHRLLETLSPAASQVISWDRPALVQLAMTAQIPLLAAKSNKGLTLALLPVFEQISWSHPQNRKALTKQLTWQSGDPAAVLQLAAALVPERVSFLNAVEGLTAASLRPLPSKEQLLSLFVLNPAPLLLKMVCEAMEQEDGGILRAASFRFEIELLQRVEGAFSHFLDAINAEELSDEQMLEAAELVVKALPLVGDLPQEKLKDFVKLSTGREKKAAALVLGSLHQMERQSWHVPAARRLLSLISEEMPSDWLLQHAVLWWSQLLPKLEKLQDFIAQLEQNYRGSLSPSDLLTWQLLCSAAQFAAGADANSWSFRSWAHRLKPLGGGTWSWDLDQRRVRATAEIFRFDRGAQEKAAERDAYDIAYLLPFLAGQLRLTYQESGGVASQSLGATLSAAMCGGALELLLLGTACAEPLLRACAFEALSIVLAIAHFWNVTSFEKDEANKRLPFRELPELVRLLCYVRDGLDTPEDDNPPTLPRLAASFFAGCVPVLIQPQHMLYQTLAKYLFGKPAADFQDVPLFYKLLLPQTADSQEARLWFLRILRRGLATGGALGGDEISRRALARRHVLPWLMSFAGSKELGSFPILMEVINCLEASLTAPTYAAEGTALRLSVAEWTANQAVRPSGARHSVQVLLALGRLVTALLKMPGGDLEKSRVAKHGTHLLTLGRALKALATACRHTLESSDEETQDASRLKLVTMLWEQIGRLGKLVQRLQALDSGIVEEDASNRCAAAGWALAAELDSALKLTSLCGRLMKLDEVSQSRKLSAQALVKVASSSSSLKDLLGELVVLLQATPSSTLLYNMVVDVVQHTLVEGDVKTCWSLETQQEAVSAMWQILRAKAKKVFTCSETKESLCKMLCAVLALPHHPSMEWRVRLLIAAILSLQQAPDEQLQRLLAELPSPMKAICPKEDGGKHLEPTVTNVLRYVLVPEAKSAQLRRKSEKLLQ